MHAPLPLAALLLPLLAALPLPRGERARVGDPVPDCELPHLDAHDGRTRLAQYRGHPVLLVGWRQWIPEPSGLHGVWFAWELLKEHADDGLVVILEDRGVWTADRWWGARSFWIRSFSGPVLFAAGHPERDPDLSIERVESERDDHSAVLIGVDGTLLFEGTLEDEAKGPVCDRVRELVRKELERRKKGWGEDRRVKKARAHAFGDGRYDRALAEIARSEAPAEELAAVRAEIEATVRVECGCIEYLVERGRYFEAETRFDALRKGCKGEDALLPGVEALAPRFEGDAAKEAKKLARRLGELLEPIAEQELRKLDLDALMDLRELARANPDHPVGRRAARLDPLVSDLARIARGIGREATWREMVELAEEERRRGR